MTTICDECGRPRATQEDYDTIPEGEGEGLCWGEWAPEQCRWDWFERDPTQFYAGDLRRMGVAVPESIPNCAHVPRSSIRFGEPSFVTGQDGKTITGDIGMEFTEPFRWITINLNITPKEKP